MGREAYHRSAPRLLYRPHYIDAPERRIDVPAISFTHPRDAAAGAGDLEYLDDLVLGGATSANPGGDVCEDASIATSVAYLSALAQDPERLAAARALVPRAEERRGYAAAFERAFGANLRVVRLEQAANDRRNSELYEPHIRQLDEARAGMAQKTAEFRESGGEIYCRKVRIPDQPRSAGGHFDMAPAGYFTGVWPSSYG